MKTGKGLATATQLDASRRHDLEYLMHRYQQADAAAVAELVAILSPKLLRFFAGPWATRDLAEDALQECWLRIHQARHTHRPGTSVLPWVFAIARHTRVDVWRRSKKFRQVSLEDVASEFPASGCETRSAIDVDRLLAELPESQSEVIYMTKVLGLSVEETASATGSTAGAVKQKAYRAYERLRRLLAADSGHHSPAA